MHCSEKISPVTGRSVHKSEAELLRSADVKTDIKAFLFALIANVKFHQRMFEIAHKNEVGFGTWFHTQNAFDVLHLPFRNSQHMVITFFFQFASEVSTVSLQ